MKQITVRNVPEDLARALGRERRRRGQSLNGTVLDLLRRALGLSGDERHDNGLGRFAGSWSEQDLAEVETATAPFEEIDDELWA